MFIETTSFVDYQHDTGAPSAYELKRDELSTAPFDRRFDVLSAPTREVVTRYFASNLDEATHAALRTGMLLRRRPDWVAELIQASKQQWRV